MSSSSDGGEPGPTQPHPQCKPDEWKLGPHAIPERDEFVYLGYLLNNKNTYKHLNQVMNNKALKATYALLRASKGAPITVAKKLFDQLVTPVHMLRG